MTDQEWGHSHIPLSVCTHTGEVQTAQVDWNMGGNLAEPQAQMLQA